MRTKLVLTTVLLAGHLVGCRITPELQEGVEAYYEANGYPHLAHREVLGPKEAAGPKKFDDPEEDFYDAYEPVQTDDEDFDPEIYSWLLARADDVSQPDDGDPYADGYDYLPIESADVQYATDDYTSTDPANFDQDGDDASILKRGYSTEFESSPYPDGFDQDGDQDEVSVLERRKGGSQGGHKAAVPDDQKEKLQGEDGQTGLKRPLQERSILGSLGGTVAKGIGKALPKAKGLLTGGSKKKPSGSDDSGGSGSGGSHRGSHDDGGSGSGGSHDDGGGSSGGGRDKAAEKKSKADEKSKSKEHSKSSKTSRSSESKSLHSANSESSKSAKSDFKSEKSHASSISKAHKKAAKSPIHGPDPSPAGRDSGHDGDSIHSGDSAHDGDSVHSGDSAHSGDDGAPVLHAGAEHKVPDHPVQGNPHLQEPQHGEILHGSPGGLHRQGAVRRPKEDKPKPGAERKVPDHPNQGNPHLPEPQRAEIHGSSGGLQRHGAIRRPKKQGDAADDSSGGRADSPQAQGGAPDPAGRRQHEYAKDGYGQHHRIQANQPPPPDPNDHNAVRPQVNPRPQAEPDRPQARPNNDQPAAKKPGFRDRAKGFKDRAKAKLKGSANPSKRWMWQAANTNIDVHSALKQAAKSTSKHKPNSNQAPKHTFAPADVDTPDADAGATVAKHAKQKGNTPMTDLKKGSPQYKSAMSGARAIAKGAIPTDPKMWRSPPRGAARPMPLAGDVPIPEE